MYVCICNQITESQLRDEIERGSSNIRQLRDTLGVTNQCGKCASCVKSCLKEHNKINHHSEILLSPACSA